MLNFKANPTQSIIMNACLFQLGWFGCVLGGDLLAPFVTISILLVHHLFILSSRKEWVLIGVVSFLGIVLDSSLSLWGILQWQSPYGFPIPIWLICLWLVFATTLKHSLFWLNKHWALPIILGFVAGPGSYWSGCALTDVSLKLPTTLSLLILGICWSIALKVFATLASKL